MQGCSLKDGLGWERVSGNFCQTVGQELQDAGEGKHQGDLVLVRNLRFFQHFAGSVDLIPETEAHMLFRRAEIRG